MTLGGLYHSFTSYNRLPVIAPNYTDNIEAKLTSRQFDKAAEEMRMALVMESGGSFPQAKVELSLGNAMASHNAVPQAVYHFERAVQIDPEFAQAHYALGVAVARQGDHQAAERYFQKAIQLDQDYAAPYYGLGKLHEANKQMPEAIKYFEQAVSLFEETPGDEGHQANQLEPDRMAFARVHNTLAVARFHADDASGALVHIKKAQEMDDTFAEAHNNAGLIYVKLGEPRTALEHLETALQINPKFERARMNYDATMRILQQDPGK